MIGKNKKAFTLVEVLTVIVILGILSTIGIVTVVNIRKNQEKKFDQTQYELFKETAKTYFSDNKSQLPSVTNGTNTIYLDDLIKENYLDSLLDYDKNNYDLDSSVTITKLGDNQYFYTVKLHKNGSKEDIPDMNDTDSDKGINFDNYRKDTKDSTDKIGCDGCDSGENEKIYYTNKTVKIDLKIQDDQGIMAFAYVLYKNNIRIYTSEYISGNNTTEELSDTLVIDTNNHGDGTYQIEVLVYDCKDHVKSNKSEKIIIDRVAPTCKVTGGSTTWINKTSTTQSITITAKCIDTGGSGCQKDSFQKTYQDNINTTTAGAVDNNKGGAVYDNAGNSTKCEANQTVKIDKTPPTCEVSGGSTTWINKTSTTQYRTITAKCIDTGGSGCATSPFSHKYETNINTTVAGAVDNNKGGTVYDNAGNVTNCSANQTVKIDKTPPTCEVSGGSTTWINKASTTQYRTITAKCIDTGGSGCATSPFSHKYETNINTTVAGAVDNNKGGTVYDNAGNVTNCSANQTVKIDKTPPSCSVVAKKTDANGDNYSSGSWTAKNIYTKANCSDALSSCSSTKKVTTTGATTNHTNYETSTYTVKAKGNSYVTWKVYDVAGNSATCSKLHVKKGKKSRDSSCGTETYTYTGTCTVGSVTAAICKNTYNGSFSQSSQTTQNGTGTCTYSCKKTGTRYQECWHF